MDNCINEGTIIGEGNRQGGIAGVNRYIIQNCENKGNIKNNGASTDTSCYVAGIVGQNVGKILKCKNYADITTSSTVSRFIGGITGFHQDEEGVSILDVILTECANTGNVSGNTFVGGIIGRLGIEANVNSCYNTGNISGSERVGGVIGDTIAQSGEAKNLYNTGAITATTNYVGGIVGILYSTLENAYNIGTISIAGSSANYGGIVGYINTTSSSIDKVQNCYYLNTSTTKAVGNISTIDTTSSRTSDEIKNLAETLGDAFKNSTEGDGYPKLNWE